MSLLENIKNYIPVNPQEQQDKEQMLAYMKHNIQYLSRDNQIAHFTTSIWTVNKERTKTLMVYHNIYNSWSWIGGHADGEEDLCAVALRELKEETGICNAKLNTRNGQNGRNCTFESVQTKRNCHIKRSQHQFLSFHFMLLL